MKKKLIITAIVLALTLVFAACAPLGDVFAKPGPTSGNGEYAVHSFRHVIMFEHGDNVTGQDNALITSADELAAYRTKSDVDAMKKYNNRELVELLDTYTGEYFENYVLIAIYRMENSGSNQYSVKNVYGTDGTVHVQLEYKTPGPGEEGTCDMCGWCILVEFEKGDIQSLAVTGG